VSQFDTRLRAAGLGAGAAARAATFEELTRTLSDLRGGDIESPCTLFVPGRLELVGKHTDYAGGRSLVCAIGRGLCVVSAPRSDGRIRVVDRAIQDDVEFAFEEGITPPIGHWSNYPMTVARRLAHDFPECRTGADIVFASDLPRASGMSSGSALVVAMFFAVADASSLQQTARYRDAIHTPEDLADYLSAVENGGAFFGGDADRGVGTEGGSEDHVAILCSRSGSLRQYSYCPVRFEREVALSDRHTFVFASSGMTAAKTGAALAAYNEASRATQRLLEVWRSATGRRDPTLAAALASRPTALDEMRRIVGDGSTRELLGRLDQFAEESGQLVPAAADALAIGDVARLGAIVDRSQELAERHLANQVPETIHLARAARRLGALAASAFGAGFGGSVWALVEADAAETFRAKWMDDYFGRFPERSHTGEFFVSRPGPAAFRL